MASCTVKPYVQTRDGQMVESKLFNDLLHYSGNDRAFAKQYYGIATDPEFQKNFGSQLSYDSDTGEVTFKSLKSVLKFDIGKEKLLKTLNSDLGAGVYDYRQAIDKLQSFNRNSQYNDDYLATLKETEDGKYELSIVEKTAANEEALNKVISNRSLYDRLIFHLQQQGVNVEFLEKGPSRYSTVNAEQAADGLYSLIQLAHGEHQTEDLAEEAGHFAVGALGNNPLVQRLMENLTPEVSKALLGEEYETKYLGVYGRREVAGALVGKALNNDIDQRNMLSSLLDRIVNLAKKTFAKFTGNEVLAAKVEAQEIASEIAKGFMSATFQGGVENALQTQETLYNAELSPNVKAFKTVANSVYAMARQLEAINSSLALQMGSILEEMEQSFSLNTDMDFEKVNAFNDLNALKGIAQCVQIMMNMMVEEIPGRLDSINFSNSLTFAENQAQYGQKLRELHIFTQNAIALTNELLKGLSGSQEFQSLTVAGVESADPTTGRTQQGMSLKDMSSHLQGILTNLQTNLFAKEKEYFSRFLKEIYGKDYIETSNMRLFQKMGTKVGNPITGDSRQQISLNDLLSTLDADISLFDAFLGSMSNSSDVISQIMDKAVKAFNMAADRAVDRDQDALKVLKAKFEFLQKSGAIGKEGMETFYEVSERTGKLTGNFRTEHKWGDWESDWMEFKSECARQFHMQHALTLSLDGKEISRSEYRDLSDEDQRRVRITSSDLDGRSQIFKDNLWENFFKPKRIRWNKEHSVWSNELERWIPNDSYRDYGYDQWADRSCTMYKLTSRTSKGREYAKFLTQEEYDKLSESEQENCTKEEVSIRSLMGEFMGLHSMLCAKVEDQMPFYRAPQVKGTFKNKRINRLEYDYDGKSARRSRAFGKTLRREIIDDFCEDSEDTDYGSTHTYNTIDEDVFGNELFFEKEKMNRLPLFYINKLKDTSEMSTDIFQALLAFSSMANSYYASSQVVHAAEVGANVLKERQVAVGNNPVLGRDFWGNLVSGKDKRNTGGLAYRRYLKYLEKQVYGIGLKKVMITKRVCLTKITSLLSKLSSMVYLGGNVAGGLVNVGTGFNEMFKEACTGQFYTLRNFTNAHKQYWGSAASSWANLGELAKEDKVSLLIRYFDILGENRGKQRSWYTSKNKFFGNFLFGESLMLPYSSGEHYMQSVTYLSLLDAIKVYDSEGNEIKLFDAYKVVDIGGGHKSLMLSSGKEGSRDLIAMEEMYNWLDEIIHDVRPHREYHEKLGNWTEEERNILKELERFNNGRPVEPQHMIPMQLQNLLTEAIAEKKMFFKSEDGFHKYQSLRETLDKVLNAVHVSDIEFNDEELETLRKYKIYPDEGTRSEFNDEQYEDIVSALHSEIEGLTWNDNDEINFMDKAKEISDRLHGIYNRMDKTWAHQNIFSNMLLVMKGYALGMLQRRFGVAKHSIALDTDVEGSVRTFAKMVQACATDRKIFGLTIASSFSMFLSKNKQDAIMDKMKAKGFNEYQYYNMRRNALDMLLIGALTLLKMLSAKGGDDDDDDESLLLGWVYYLSYRLDREQRAFNFPGAFLMELTNLTNITPPGVSILEDFYQIGEGMVGTSIYDYQDGMTSNDPGAKYFYLQKKTGLYEKGDRKWVRKLSKMAPYYKSRYVIYNPYEAVESYDYGRRVNVK